MHNFTWQSTLSPEPPLDQHMPFFTCKCFPSTSKQYSRQYQVLAETKCFVWFARNYTLYPGSWSKWKLPLNKITSGDVQQAKQWTQKLALSSATKLSLITACKGWVVSTGSVVFPTSALKNVHVVTWKLDLDQMSVKTLIKLTFSTESLYWLTESWYRNISLLLVPHTDSLNSLAITHPLDHPHHTWL